MRRIRKIGTGALVIGLMLFTACGRGSNSNGVGALTIELTSTATGAPVSPGGTATVIATVYDQNDRGVTWTITPLDFGTLSPPTSTSQPSNFQTVSSVTYTAPINVTANTTVSIIATSVTNPSITATLQFKIVPITVALSLQSTFLPAAAQTLEQGQPLQLLASVENEIGTSQGVSWSLSPASGAGSLTVPTLSSVTYTAPSAISSPTTVSVIATSITNSNATASVQITVFPSGGGSNVAAIHVDGGPVPGQVYVNGAFTSVTVCNPGSNLGTPTCQTIDGVLVDTGSYGLRILQSQIPTLKLPTFTDGNGDTLENCVSQIDGAYLWGPVSQADIYISGEAAFAVPIQVIATTPVAGVGLGVPNACSNGGTDTNTPQLLGANGILGIGPEPTDCTVAGVNFCDGKTQSTPPNLYYSCLSAVCGATDSPVIVADIQQVTNPVVMFAGDSQGVILQLPPVSGHQPSLTGQLIFGINSEANNALGAATVFTLDSNDYFTTILNGQSLTSSFIDSGSPGLFFPDSLPVCPVHTQFFCPTSLTGRSATIQGATQGQSSVSFNVDNADSLLASYPNDAAFYNLAGPEGVLPTCSSGASCSFDWGLPFFFGRTVYIAIDKGVVSSAPNPPWWAY